MTYGWGTDLSTHGATEISSNMPKETKRMTLWKVHSCSCWHTSQFPHSKPCITMNTTGN